MEEKVDLSLRRYWHLLANYLDQQKGRVILLTILALGSIGLRLANPQIVRFFLDAAETGSGLDRLFGAASLFMAFAVLQQILQVGVTYTGENVAWTATNLLRADLALHCLKLDMSFHKKYKPGELIERVDGDVNQLANFFSQLVVRLGGNLLLVIGVLVLLWIQDWRIGLSITIAVAVGLFILDKLNKRLIPRFQDVRESEAKLFGFLEEWLNGTEEIQTNNAKPYIMLRLFHALRARWQKILSAMRIQALIASLPLNVFGIAYVAAHILGSTLFRDGAITIGELYVIFYYFDVMKGPLWEILRQIEELQRASASINRISEILRVQPTILDGDGITFPAGSLGVVFENVSFHYEDDPDTNILQHINFKLEPGKVLGLLGRTGSGKSTLTKLLIRFHDPSLGMIRMGNKHTENGRGEFPNIRVSQLSHLRQHISMVTQEVQLFQATVRQNLTLFDDSITDEHLTKVIQKIGLDSWLKALPQGLDTPLDTGESGLSAGEQQLLAFGRVFLANPGLVILDEASSRLDPATEQLIEKAVDLLLEQRTGIIIAHRLATVQRADQIMILEDGQIAEFGLRTALMEDPNSLFYSLLKTGLEEALA